MNEIEKLVEICNAFKQGEFNTEEFQKRIETVYLPDICKNTLQKGQYNAFNKLEGIIYCYTESQKKYAYDVAEALISAAFLEKKRYKAENK